MAKRPQPTLVRNRDALLALALSALLSAFACIFAVTHGSSPDPQTNKTVMPRAASPGFTLIELSIVLVIIGLIVGGILTGRDLIRAAELRSVITDVEKFKTAVNTFRVQYDCIPGDCPNATTFFGAANNVNVCNQGQNYPITSGTCNGNGNGQIEFGPPNPAPAAPAAQWGHDESMLFWQQLSLAGLVPGSYNGSSMTTSGTAATWDGGVAGVNVPASNISNGCYSVGFSSETAFVGSLMSSDPAVNVFTLGNPISLQGGTVYGTWCEGGIMTANDARSIDQKIDDGLPYTGTVQVPSQSYSPSTGAVAVYACTNNTWGVPYAYQMNSGSPVCSLVFIGGF